MARLTVKELRRRLTGKELRELREKLGLTQTQLAQLVHTKPSTRATGNQSSTVQAWEADVTAIPSYKQELLEAKLYLLGAQLATFDDLIKWSLADILRDIYS